MSSELGTQFSSSQHLKLVLILCTINQIYPIFHHLISMKNVSDSLHSLVLSL